MAKKQLSLNLFKGARGGRRPKSGRKRKHSKGVAHREREPVTHRTPVHINFKVKTYIRNKDCLKILSKAIRNGRKMGLRIIHFSLQSNHIHLIIEPTSNDVLTRGMRSLTITFAKRVQKLKNLTGGIQLERYHLHVLKTLQEARNAVNYVVFNEQKHGGQQDDRYCSSGSWLNLDVPATYLLSQRVQVPS